MISKYEFFMFDLMWLFIMCKVRYKIKFLWYVVILVYIFFFYCFIFEFNEVYFVNFFFLECFIVGIFSGFIIVYLNEN